MWRMLSVAAMVVADGAWAMTLRATAQHTTIVNSRLIADKICRLCALLGAVTAQWQWQVFWLVAD
ncbi:hypothetical protein PRLR5076_15660 [Prevotella lacticifex]|uniref:Lipoprotein n=1 Tax=Prevotella lacticifex TaxID=2854755 RepID=A0A9R1CA31_9BACT|nr:hypothetical protein PRLR5027_14270 [Prevotella lacticifex]GJG58715.1 hypothetical protein PRLR5076_15660 [Prevotella lacticifex]